MHCHRNPDNKVALHKDICEPTQIEATDNLERKRKVMGRRGVLGLLAGGAAALLSACGENDGTFRYRLAFAVSVNGAVKSGSSIISVRYRGGQPGWETGVATYTTTEGVAPVIDLGQNGMLVAAMTYDVGEWASHKKQYGLACKQPVPADSLPGKFSLKLAALVNLREGKVTTHPWDEVSLDRVREHIRLSVRAMKAYLKDPDRNLADEANFEKAEELRICRWCNFRAVCRPELPPFADENTPLPSGQHPPLPSGERAG